MWAWSAESLFFFDICLDWTVRMLCFLLFFPLWGGLPGTEGGKDAKMYKKDDDYGTAPTTRDSLIDMIVDRMLWDVGGYVRSATKGDVRHAHRMMVCLYCWCCYTLILRERVDNTALLVLWSLAIL